MADSAPWTIKAFKPSRFGGIPEEDTKNRERDKAENVQMYAKKAAAGIPLFESARPQARVTIGGYE